MGDSGKVRVYELDHESKMRFLKTHSHNSNGLAMEPGKREENQLKETQSLKQREGSKVDGANPSEAVLGIWVCSVPVWEHQSSAHWARSALLWERPASGARRESEPTGAPVVALLLFGLSGSRCARRGRGPEAVSA